MDLALDISFVCHKCGDDLGVMDTDTRYDKNTIKLAPCTKCVEQAYELAQERGEEAGYSNGFRDGYSEGKGE